MDPMPSDTTVRLVVSTIGLSVALASHARAQAAGPSAAYAMDEGTGSVVGDRSGNGNVGTLTNGPVWTTGRFGAALQFDGVDDRVRIPDSSSLDLTSAATFEAWVFPTAVPTGWRTILQKEVEAYFFSASGGENRPVIGGTINGTCCPQAVGPAALAANVWTHLAATYDGSQMRLYVNGAQVASVSASGAYAVSALPLWMGGNAVYGEHFRGKIDEVRVYARALSAAEIQSDMSTPVGGAPPPPDTAPPSTPAGLAATPVSPSQINLAWSAATDNVGVTAYHVFRGGAQLASVGSTSYSDVGLAASTPYTYQVRAADAAGNVSPLSGPVSATTPATPLPDTTRPSVAITAPASGTSVAGTAVSVSASASDDVGVVGVQFLLDGAALSTTTGSAAAEPVLPAASRARADRAWFPLLAAVEFQDTP